MIASPAPDLFGYVATGVRTLRPLPVRAPIAAGKPAPFDDPLDDILPAPARDAAYWCAFNLALAKVAFVPAKGPGECAWCPKRIRWTIPGEGGVIVAGVELHHGCFTEIHARRVAKAHQLVAGAAA